MFSFWKRKKADDYVSVFQTEEDRPAEGSGADTETVITLEDGRAFPADFVREIRSYEAADLKCILEEQSTLYTPAEYAYIEEVFRERLGDL